MLFPAETMRFPWPWLRSESCAVKSPSYYAPIYAVHASSAFAARSTRDSDSVVRLHAPPMQVFLHQRGYRFLRIDGSTAVSERQALIDRYSADTGILVFLLSTRAGGLGINLTAADTVIIHDIDHNPQQDKQAEDRCHRVGQTRPVTIHRMVAAGTVEQLMLKSAQNKLKLDDDISTEDNTGNLSKEATAKLLKDSIDMLL